MGQVLSCDMCHQVVAYSTVTKVIVRGPQREWETTQHIERDVCSDCAAKLGISFDDDKNPQLTQVTGENNNG